MDKFDRLINKGHYNKANSGANLLLLGSDLDKAKGKLQLANIKLNENVSDALELSNESMIIFEGLPLNLQESNNYLTSI